MMSDIDEDMMTFQTELGAISLGGISHNTKSIISSTKNININSNGHRLEFPQQHVRDMYGEKGLSPMSLRKGLDLQEFGTVQITNSHRSYTDQKSGRGRSQFSCRSVDSTVSVLDIKNAIKCENFSIQELRAIKEIVTIALKHKSRRRYEKYRHKFLIRKSTNCKRPRSLIRCDSDNDSSELANNSSSDEQSSLRYDTVLGPKNTGVNKSLLMSSINQNFHSVDQTMRNNKNVFSVMPKTNKVSEEMRSDSKTHNKMQTLKETFTEKYMFPSQRFDQTKTELKINDLNIITDSPETPINLRPDDLAIFSSSESRKRSHEINLNNNVKRIKTACPTTSTVQNNIILQNKDIFNPTFKKPCIPQSQSNKKNDTNDNYLHKLMQPVNGIINISEKDEDLPNPSEELKISNTSTKSCYMKRKLFTQTADLYNSKALHNSAGQSPQTKVDNKKKNKVRKLVSTQSCLYRNVSDEEDNILGLINKIVSPEKKIVMSFENTKTNKIDSDVSDTFTDDTISCRSLDIEQAGIDKDKNESSATFFQNPENRFASHNVVSQKGSKNKKFIQSFWDTDIESEMESNNIPIWKIVKPNQHKDYLKDVTLTTHNTRSKDAVGKILTVQNLKNSKNKRLNTIKETNETLKNNAVSNGITQDQDLNGTQNRKAGGRNSNNSGTSNTACKLKVSRDANSASKENRNETFDVNISDNSIFNITINSLRPRKAKNSTF